LEFVRREAAIIVPECKFSGRAVGNTPLFGIFARILELEK
jgi:hypothetical protein